MRSFGFSRMLEISKCAFAEVDTNISESAIATVENKVRIVSENALNFQNFISLLVEKLQITNKHGKITQITINIKITCIKIILTVC